MVMNGIKTIPIGKAKDIRGIRFGRLVVLDRVENKYNKTAWLCKCDCGNYITAVGTGLTTGDYSSCGCKRYHDIVGKKFGRWTAIEMTNKRSSSGDAIWKCLCECGTSGEVKKSKLKDGTSKSCGCLNRELTSKRRSDSGLDLTNKTFGRLKVLRPTGEKNSEGRIWFCECECGGTIETSARSLNGGRTKSCGCLQVDKVTQLGLSNKGINNPAYNHELTTEQREINKFHRTSANAKRLRLEVYKRDNFKCQVCSKNISKDFVAHHLDGFADNKDKRFDMDNLITLCKDCHTSFHKAYGYGNNTAEQFKSFKLINKNKVKQLPVI